MRLTYLVLGVALGAACADDSATDGDGASGSGTANDPSTGGPSTGLTTGPTGGADDAPPTTSESTSTPMVDTGLATESAGPSSSDGGTVGDSEGSAGSDSGSTGASTSSGSDSEGSTGDGTCPPANGSAINDNCTSDLDCPACYTCQGFSGIVFSQTCQILCDLEDAGSCPPGTNCQTIMDKSMVPWNQCV